MENYKETEWSSSSQVENELKQLESLHQKEFGDDSSEGISSTPFFYL